MIRKLIIELRPDTCGGKGPDISILLDGELLDRLIVDRPMTWHIYKKILPGDHNLSICFHNEDNTRFYDWGEDPDGEIRALHVDAICFANDGANAVVFDLSSDVLGDWTPLFKFDEPAGITYSGGLGFSMFKNGCANVILPVR